MFALDAQRGRRQLDATTSTAPTAAAAAAAAAPNLPKSRSSPKGEGDADGSGARCGRHPPLHPVDLTSHSGGACTRLAQQHSKGASPVHAIIEQPT